MTYLNCGGIRACEIVKTYAETGSATGSIDLALYLDDVQQPIFKLCLISGVATNTTTAKYRNAEEFAQKVKSSIENLKGREDGGRA